MRNSRGMLGIWILCILMQYYQHPTAYAIALKNEVSFEMLHIKHLRYLLDEIISIARVKRCFVIITDEWYQKLYDGDFFYYIQEQQVLTWFYIKIDASEDLLSPNYQVVRILKQIKKANCDLHIITLLNGLQVQRFLLFVEKYRILNLQCKFIFMYDRRLIVSEMISIWSKIVQSIFITFDSKQIASFRISTVNFPSVLNGIITFKHLVKWTKGLRLHHNDLFFNRLSNLNGYDFPVAVDDHLPMVTKSKVSKNLYQGVEIEIVRLLGKALNFIPNFYQPNNSLNEFSHFYLNVNQQQYDDSISGPIMELMKGNALISIGDIHLFTTYTAVVDFGIPHTHECLTFLTPASSQDNSWKTFILPFRGNMWIGVLLSLFLVGTIFYILSYIHAILIRRQNGKRFFKLFRKRNRTLTLLLNNPNILRSRKFRLYLYRLKFDDTESNKNDLFDHFSNCILLTYSMLLYISLPATPKNWPLRVLTGWYWIYCILLTVAYRASFTAILANPASRIAIDTLEELTESNLKDIVASQQEQNLFCQAFDSKLRKLCENIQILEDKDDANNVINYVSKGTHVYLDNEYYLRHLRWSKNQNESSRAAQFQSATLNEDILHIMKQCVIRMPVGLAIVRNSPFKSFIDKYVRRSMEFGLIQKWLKDATEYLPIEEESPQEALIDLHKFWGIFIPLFIGYIISVIAAICEIYYFKRVVQQHPLYDAYNTRLYYNFLRKYDC